MEELEYRNGLKIEITELEKDGDFNSFMPTFEKINESEKYVDFSLNDLLDGGMSNVDGVNYPEVDIDAEIKDEIVLDPAFCFHFKRKTRGQINKNINVDEPFLELVKLVISS